MTTAYKAFPDAPGASTTSRPSICVVTGELVGPFKNGGIGTSMTGFADCLAKAGFAVTILYTGGQFLSAAAREHWQAQYAGIGITLNWLHPERSEHMQGRLIEQGFAAAYLVYEALRDSRFDILQFNDCMGEGVYCLTMKRLGVAFGTSTLCVGLHSPSQWIFAINRQRPQYPLMAAWNYAERLSTQCADLLWSPSRYLLDWIRAHEFSVPEATYVQQYAIPMLDIFSTHRVIPEMLPASPITAQPKEMIFFGRLEERKGLRLFCAMLTKLNPLLTRRAIKVRFFGKPSQIDGISATDYLRVQSRSWTFDWDVESGFGQQEALDYLRTNRPLVVMPSPADNSPCTVYEALSFGLTFLAARTGGIPELVAEADHGAVLFDYSLPSLAQKVSVAIEQGIAPARAAFSADQLRQRWVSAFGNLAALTVAETVALEPERAISALIEVSPDCGPGAALAAVLTLPQTARVLVINRAGAPVPSIADPRVTWLDGAEWPDARLSAWIAAGADHALLMLQPGVMPLVTHAADLLTALRYPAVDGLMPAARTAPDHGAKIIPPLGGGQSYCYFHGAVQAGGLVVKAERLLAILGTRPRHAEAAFFGLADLAVAEGLQIWPYAEPVLEHVVRPAIPLNGLRAPERIAAYVRATPIELYYIMAISIAEGARATVVGGRLRAARDALLRMRAGWVVSLAKRVIPRRVINALLRRL